MALLLALSLPLSAQPVERAALIIPPLDNWVVDTTHTFDAAQKKALADRLEAFEQSKGAQIFVLMIPSTAPEDIEQYTRRAYDQWKIGRKHIDDGVLLVVAKEDRRLRIEVGYGLEGAITDLQAGRIIREFITPYFMHDDYVGGINAGVTQLIALVDGEELPPPVRHGQELDTEEDGPLAMLLPLAFFAFVLPPVAAAFIIGLFSFFLFWSVPAAIAFGIVAFVLSLVGKAFGAGAKGNSGLASRRGSRLGGLGGGGGGGMGGGGSSGPSGGGGGSGGGGASGGW